MSSVKIDTTGSEVFQFHTDFIPTQISPTCVTQPGIMAPVAQVVLYVGAISSG